MIVRKTLSAIPYFVGGLLFAVGVLIRFGSERGGTKLNAVTKVLNQ